MPTTPPPPPTYQRITQGAFLTLLSGQLEDSGNVFWSLPELRLYLAEALRTWQSYTGWYRNRAVLSAVANDNWYDLTASLTPSLMAYVVTDQYLAQSILYHLLETQLANGTWTGTDQFTLAQVQAAIQNRLNRFLGDSGLVTSYVLQASGLAPPASRAVVPTGTIDIRRLAWVDASGTVTVLWKSSEWELASFMPGWVQTAQLPQVYSESLTAPGQIQIAPPPLNSGNLEFVLISPGPTVNLAAGGAGVVLNLPCDFSWGVKWGALADLLLGSGQGGDTTRAQYCEQRYQECVQIASTFPAVMQLSVNGVPVYVGSVFEMDAFAPGWPNRTPGVPDTFGMAGRNLLAMAPAPTAAMSMTVDMVADIPLPASDSDFVTIPSDALAVLIDYAQHLASFKMGGTEFMATIQKHKNLLIEAAEYNQRLRQLNLYNDAMRSPSLTQSGEQPRMTTPMLAAYQSGINQGGGNG